MTDRSSAGRSQEAWLRHLSRRLVMMLSAWLAAPLDHIGARAYSASVLRNTPDNMITWLRHPRQ